MMRYYYEINRRKVAGLETSYEEWVVSLQDETGREVERVAAFMHEACAAGLQDQLQRAYEHGQATVPRAQPSPSVALRDPARCGDGCEGCASCWQGDWEASIAEAHESLNRLEDVAMHRLADSFEAEGAEQAPAPHRAPYVDIKGNDGGTTRVHLLADDPGPHRAPSSAQRAEREENDPKRRDTRPGLGTRTFLPPKMDKIDD